MSGKGIFRRRSADGAGSETKETGMSMLLLSALKNMIGAEKAIACIEAKPDAADISAFTDDITAHFEEMKATIGDLQGKLDVANQEVSKKDKALVAKDGELATANAAPPVVTLEGDASAPEGEEKYPQTEAGWTKEYEASSELQKIHPDAAHYCFYKTHQDEIDEYAAD